MLSRLSCLLEDPEVADNIGDLEVLNSRLPRSEYLALPADLKVLFGDLKSVVRFFHYPKPFLCNSGLFVACEQNAKTLFRPAAYAPAKLMKLREPKAFRVFDD